MRALAEDKHMWRTIWIGTAGILVMIPISYALRYRRSIRRRIKEIEDSFSQPVMVRSAKKSSSDDREIRCLELNPEFVELHKDKWKLVSLGQYLNSLRPCLPGSAANPDDDNIAAQQHSKLPKFIEQELEATIGAVLLRALGRRFGGAVLPLMGITDVHSTTAKFATTIASWWVSHFMVRSMDSVDPEDYVKDDVGSLPLNLNEIVALANLNAKFVPSNMKIKSLEWLRRGEIGYEPTFGRPLPTSEASDDNKGEDSEAEERDDLPELIPNPFIVSTHWDSAIEGLEKLIMSQDVVTSLETPNAEVKESTTKYDPNSRDFPEPTPINERLLPDLYLGWGNATCTHSKREIIRNRLFAVLFNKLSHNFYKSEQHQKDDLFVVKMTNDGKSFTYPQDFLQGLMDAGHTVEMCPRSTITSFGLAVCIKEHDGSWSNVPIGLFLKSGYEGEDSDSRPAHYVMPHGGMDLRLTGPLVGKDANGNDQNCDIQFYMAIEGMCGWHSNHNADVPWLQKISTTEIYTRKQALLAMKLAGTLAVAFNALGTEMDLPYGGYGVLGVCNDTAALLDFAVRGETSMFPLVSTGRFLIRSGRRLIQGYAKLKDFEDNQEPMGKDIRRLIAACCKIQSDLQASPANLINSSKRFLASQPETLCFQLEQESKDIMTELMAAFDGFDESIQYTSIFQSTLL